MELLFYHMGTRDVGVVRIRNVVVWLRVAKKLRCTSFIGDSKNKRLVMVKDVLAPLAHPT